jgi:hypothetical protein
MGQQFISLRIFQDDKARKLQGHQLARVTFALQELEN